MNGGEILKLQTISFRNYRGIPGMVMDFEGDSAILYGINGVGKTSILKGIALLFSQIITRVVDSQFRQQLSITGDDVRFGHSEATLSGDFQFEDDQIHQYSFSYRKATETKRSSRKDLTDFAEAFQETYLNDDKILPVFAFYGVNRAVLDIPLRIRTKHEFGRLAAYQNALSTRTDFRSFFEWFRNQEDIENEEKVKKNDFAYKDPALQAVKTAIMEMLPDLSDIRIARRPLQMCATKYNQTLSMEQLSDGEKCVLAMLGDLARRLALANPDSADPLSGTGIVLIDEIELHMHPSWQRKIVRVLHQVFPNIQFFITTHSPQVLGEPVEGFRIFNLEQRGTAFSYREIPPGYYDTNLVLEDRMGTPSISPIIGTLENEIFEDIKARDFSSAKEKVLKLSKLTRNTHPSITKAQILISREERR